MEGESEGVTTDSRPELRAENCSSASSDGRRAPRPPKQNGGGLLS